MASRDMPRLIAWVARVCLSWCGVTRPRPAHSAARRTAASIRDFATWQPVPKLLRAVKAGKAGADPTRVAGRVGRKGWSLALPHPVPPPGRALHTEDMHEEIDAVEPVHTAMTEVGADDISFSAKTEPTGTTLLRLLGPSPAVEPGIGNPHPGALILAEDSLPKCG